jgi:hypothetical protein
MTDEHQLLEAARAGDEKAFALLLGPYQAQLRQGADEVQAGDSLHVV